MIEGLAVLCYGFTLFLILGSPPLSVFAGMKVIIHVQCIYIYMYMHSMGEPGLEFPICLTELLCSILIIAVTFMSTIHVVP